MIHPPSDSDRIKSAEDVYNKISELLDGLDHNDACWIAVLVAVSLRSFLVAEQEMTILEAEEKIIRLMRYADDVRTKHESLRVVSVN